MSELIDRIFDTKNIEKEISDIKSYLATLKGDLSAYAEELNKITDMTRLSKSIDDLEKNTKKYNDTVVKGSQSLNIYAAMQKQLEAQEKKLLQAEAAGYTQKSKTNEALVKAAKSNKEYNEIIKQETILTDKNSGSIEKAIAKNKLLEIEKKKLNLETKEGSDRLTEINAEQDKNNKLVNSSGNAVQKQKANIGNYKSALSGLFDSFAAGEIGLKGLTNGFLTLTKTMLANPILLVGASIIGLIKGMSDAVAESEERSNKLSEAFARFKPILRTIGDGFEFLVDIVIASVEWLGKAYAAVTEFLGINPKGSADAFVAAEKLKQDAILKTRKLNEDASNQEAIIEEQRAIIADKESYTYEQRVAALKKAGIAEKKLSDDRLKISELNLKALQAEAALDDNNAEMNQRLSDAIVSVNKARQENAAVSRKLAKDEQKLIKEHEADMKAEADAAKAAADKIIAARRRLVDSQLALMEDGVDKEIAISNENYNRQIQDLKRNGEYTKELGKNLQKIHEKEIQKIKDDAAKKDEEKRKADEDKKIAEMEKAYQDFQKGLTKQTEALSREYAIREKDLKAAYARGEMSEEDYQDELTKIKLDALLDVNNKTIEALQKELNNAELSDDKRAELSNKLADLQIQNENAVLDATIKANDDKVKADKDAVAKRIEVANALSQATMEIFGGIAEFQKQQSENRIAELEQQQEKNDETFEKAQSNLDNSIMSDENRAAKQKEINEKKAAADKEIADKIQAEKIKQAKWDKANSLVQAIISNGLVILNASQTKPFIPLGLIAAGLAATMGAIQIATIASQQIPAYERGTDNHPGGLSLWGEKRPEIAVTPTGDVLLAEKPTISHFDAGTKIYKSVSDYENFMAKQAVNQVVFDYDKLAASIPSNEFEFDGNGLLIARDKRGNRRTLINRRYKL